MNTFFPLLMSKPVLVGLHLGFAIIGIDFFLWLLGEFIAEPVKRFRLRIVAFIGLAGFLLSWIIGGYYYIKFYGPLVKPIIKAGAAPWAHAVAMETKEHVFLFIIPMALTALFISFLSKEQFSNSKLKLPTILFIGSMVAVALAIGAMGYIISAAARWS
ncbi:MAG: hypothetical protein A2843_02625 [Candidatus Wildermuthbacteria bacterium RIFCSPHIGHO2_01_FULL_48_27b]|uniref:DUF2231 domain-containing protein n=1 Tax=Candidatus Wildermuthbacteria bacterium RIFCSPHIGHO2_01_FULL_48_27b TaxID=1802447 RepID=A0A1G2QWZ9_9BACT|nr:MAG: hypothetical protein A2843_02625 [Candidatus Wildermuthbacteria bacterium RIFCSPHIGHO2_01_FULL_48_27b]